VGPFVSPTPAETTPPEGAILFGPPDPEYVGDSSFVEEGACPGGCPHRLYVNAEYLMWWLKGNPTPPLVTGSTAPGMPRAGALGAPGTALLYGGTNVDTDAPSGGRFTVGYWFDDAELYGVEGQLLFLGRRPDHFAVGSMGGVALFRPFVNARTGAEDARALAFPGEMGGRVAVDTDSEFWGAEIDGRQHLYQGCWVRVDGLLGYRYLSLDENLRVTEDLAMLGGQRGSFVVTDRFGTRNSFNGADAGLVADFKRGAWDLELRGKLALGWTHETVEVGGATFTTAPGSPGLFEGGLLALPTNIGSRSRDRFAVVPELGLNLGYQLTDWLRISLGYSFIYWSNVARPGSEVDRVINPSQIPPGVLAGTPRPAPIFRDTDFWVHGFNVGLEFRY
jgi:hypothetical protein